MTSLIMVLLSSITVFVTYFSPFGVERGVGPDVLVAVQHGTAPERYCTTDVDSSCTVRNLPEGWVSVEALYHDPNPWFKFVCSDVKELVEEQEYLIVRCRREFSFPLWFPHITAPAVKE